jgi:hypothetical protein
VVVGVLPSLLLLMIGGMGMRNVCIWGCAHGARGGWGPRAGVKAAAGDGRDPASEVVG